MSKNKRGCVLNFQIEYEMTDLLGVFDIIKPRWKEYLPSQPIILSEPVFSKVHSKVTYPVTKNANLSKWLSFIDTFPV